MLKIGLTNTTHINIRDYLIIDVVQTRDDYRDQRCTDIALNDHFAYE